MDARKIHLNLDRQTDLRVGPGIAQYITVSKQAGNSRLLVNENPIEER